jgi:hypothetical protein
MPSSPQDSFLISKSIEKDSAPRHFNSGKESPTLGEYIQERRNDSILHPLDDGKFATADSSDVISIICV